MQSQILESKNIEIFNSLVSQYYCQSCPLLKEASVLGYHSSPITNDYSLHLDNQVDILFIGEAPEEEETIQKVPFIGKAGKFIRGAISYYLKDNKDITYAFINSCMCRPYKDASLTQENLKGCSPFLVKQIELFNPKIIVALGSVSFNNLLSLDTINPSKAKLSNSIRECFNITFPRIWKKIPVYPMYHPAYLLRSENKHGQIKQELVDSYQSTLTNIIRRINETKKI